MDTTLGIQDEFSDPRDAFRNGFVTAVTHLRGQPNPTQAQVRAATDLLQQFRLANEGGDSCLARLPVRSDIENSSPQYEHSSDGPNSSRWSRRAR